jgi:hypothetical protein
VTKEEPVEDTKPQKDEEPQLTEEKTKEDAEKKEEKKRREPEKVNSRAMMLGAAPEGKRDVRLKGSFVQFQNTMFTYTVSGCISVE